MTQFMSGSAWTKTLSFCLSPLSELTSSSVGREANPVLKTGPNLVITGVWGSFPAKVISHCARRSPTCLHCVFIDCSLLSFRNLHLTTWRPISTPPAFPHANDNLFQIHVNNFLWRYSKPSSAEQPGKGMGLALTQHPGQRRPNNFHSLLPWRQLLGHRQLYLRKPMENASSY